MHIDQKANVMSQMFRKYKYPLFVHFAEPGLDGGGVTRKYFHMLMIALDERDGSCFLFEGVNGLLLYIHNYNLLSSGLFVIV